MLPCSPPLNIQDLRFDSDNQGNIIVTWISDDALWARFYDREHDAWTPPERVKTLASGAVVILPSIVAPDMNGGRAVLGVTDNDGTWAMVRGPGGWIGGSMLRLDGPNTPALAIDGAGNALAVWHSELRYRRYVAGAGWGPSSSLNANVNASEIWMTSAADGSFLLVATDLLDRGGGADRLPMAVRFE